MLTILSLLLSIEVLMPAANTACNEAGQDFYEGAMVLQVAINRSHARNLDLNTILLEKYQFNPHKKCEISEIHYTLAVLAHLDLLPVPQKIKDTTVQFYDALWSQENAHSKCPGHTIGDVWEYNGLTPVFKSTNQHIFFRKVKNIPGCPEPTYLAKKYYKKIKPSKEAVNVPLFESSMPRIIWK